MVGDAEQSIDRLHAGAPGLEEVALVRAAGEWHGLRGEWSDALRCSQYCLQSNQGDSADHATMDYLNAAIACLEVADANGYSWVREGMATRFKDPDARTAERVLDVSLMQSLEHGTAARLEPFAALLARTDPASYPVLGLLDYRRGDYAQAMESAHRSLSKLRGVALPNALDHVILAMCLHHFGDTSAADLQLEHATKLIETGFNAPYDIWHWREWILLRLLLQEAKGLTAATQPGQR